MIVELRKHRSWSTYLLRLGDSIYEVTERACTGQGVCLYQGEMHDPDDPELTEHFLTGHKYTRFPLGIIQAACTIARTDAIEECHNREVWADGV